MIQVARLPPNRVNFTMRCSPILAFQGHDTFVTHCCDCSNLSLPSALSSPEAPKGRRIWLAGESCPYTCANQAWYFLTSCWILVEKLKVQIKFILYPFHSESMQFIIQLLELQSTLFHPRDCSVMSYTKVISSKAYKDLNKF